MIHPLQMFGMGFKHGNLAGLGERDRQSAGLRESDGTLDLEADPSLSTNQHYLEGFKAGFLRGVDSDED